MGKASRKKAERHKLLDAPAVIYGHHEMTALQQQRFDAWKKWAYGLDVPDGDSVVFAPIPTWRELIFNRFTELYD